MKKTQLDEALENKGWCAIADPDTAINIYDLLYDKSNVIERFFGKTAQLKFVGSVTELFKGGNQLPEKHGIGYGANENFGDKSSQSITAKVDVLPNLLKKVGGNIKSSLSLKSASKVTFTYTSPERHFQSVGIITDYIKSGRVNELHNNFGDLKNGNVYVVYELKKTNKFDAEFFDVDNNSLNIDIDALKTDIEENVHLKTSTESKINFEGTNLISIAFKAAKIQYLGKAYAVTSSKLKDLKDVLSEIQQRLLFPLLDKLFETTEKFEAALPQSFDASVRELLMKHFEFENFKLDPTDNIKYLDGEHKITNFEAETEFVSIEF
jgi:hypothetical protein